MKTYYTYKITLLKGSLKSHYYLGKRQTNKFPDNYCGSGKILLDYYKKYGKIEGETYIKEIISFYDSPAALNEGEYILISDKYKTDEMCLNLKQGGQGGGGPRTNDTKQKISEHNARFWKGKKRPSMNKGITRSKEEKDKMSKILKAYYFEHPEAKQKLSDKLKGRHLNDETKDKLSKIMKDYYKVNKKSSVSEETRKKISNTLKEYYKNKKGAA